MRIKRKGFTLIELLIVMAIMGFLGVGILLQQSVSKEDTDLKSTASDLQSFIRIAQTNATARVLCNGAGGAYWLIRPTDTKTVELRCYTTDPAATTCLPATTCLQSTYTFKSDKILIQSILGTGGCDTIFTTQALQFKFTPLSAKPSFESSVACVPPSTFLDIKLRNTKSLNELTVNVDKGGMVDVK